MSLRVWLLAPSFRCLTTTSCDDRYFASHTSPNAPTESCRFFLIASKSTRYDRSSSSSQMEELPVLDGAGAALPAVDDEPEVDDDDKDKGKDGFTGFVRSSSPREA